MELACAHFLRCRTIPYKMLCAVNQTTQNAVVRVCRRRKNIASITSLNVVKVLTLKSASVDERTQSKSYPFPFPIQDAS